jgi:hypothetical protein
MPPSSDPHQSVPDHDRVSHEFISLRLDDRNVDGRHIEKSTRREARTRMDGSAIENDQPGYQDPFPLPGQDEPVDKDLQTILALHRARACYRCQNDGVVKIPIVQIQL